MKRLPAFTFLIALAAGCGDTTPTKKVSGSGSTTPSTTQGVAIPKDTKPKMD